MAARIVFSIVNTAPEELARTLRSLAAKVQVEDITPGADFVQGNVRVQVDTPQVSEKRAWLIAQKFEVGGRGRYTAEQDAAWEAHQKAERKRIREERAARRAEREAAALVSA